MSTTEEARRLVERLRACAEDPMWADHAEVPKVLCAAAAAEIERLTADAEAAAVRPRSWWHCETHGQAVANAWGCPECVRELRANRDTQAAEIERLNALAGPGGKSLGEMERINDGLIADNERLQAEVQSWRDTLSAVMPADCKDWHENNPAEWPEVAAAVITSLRKSETLAWEGVEVMARELDRVTAELDAAQERYMKACGLVAQMHMAAMGQTIGPKRGVVEDVADVRAERDALRADAERWRYWRNYWPALCRMEVARFARLDLSTTYVQSPADMDKVTDAARAALAAKEPSNG